MSTKVDDSRLVLMSIRLYSLLLVGYPSQFRREYGSHMLQVFRDSCRRAYALDGLNSMIMFWIQTMINYLTTVIEENLDRGTNMKKIKYTKLAGWAFIIAGVVLFVGYLVAGRPEYDSHNFASQTIDRNANIAAPVLLILGFFLAVVGMIGLLVRFGERASSFGRFSLWIGIISGLIVGPALVGLFLGIEVFWYLTWVSTGIMFLGLSLFGVDCLVQNTMPRWNGLPFLTGISIASFMLINRVYESATGGQWLSLPDIIFHLMFIVTSLGLAALGYILQSGLPEESGTTVLAAQ